MDADKSTRVRADLVEKEKANIIGCAWKDLLIPKVNHMPQVPTVGEQLPQRFAILRVEELMRQNVGELAVWREHVQAAFDEYHIEVVVALLRRFVVFLEPLNL